MKNFDIADIEDIAIGCGMGVSLAALSVKKLDVNNSTSYADSLDHDQKDAKSSVAGEVKILIDITLRYEAGYDVNLTLTYASEPTTFFLCAHYDIYSLIQLGQFKYVVDDSEHGCHCIESDSKTFRTKFNALGDDYSKFLEDNNTVIFDDADNITNFMWVYQDNLVLKPYNRNNLFDEALRIEIDNKIRASALKLLTL